MYSTLLTDEEFDPLLMVFLTTTGGTLQNHVKAQLIKGALRNVVFQEAGEMKPFDTLGAIRGSLESKRQQAADLRVEQAKAAKDIATLNTVPGVTAAPTPVTVPLPPLDKPPTGAPKNALDGYKFPPAGFVQNPGDPPWDPYRDVRGRPDTVNYPDPPK